MKVLDRTSDGLKRCYSILLAPSEIEQANLTKLKDVAGKVKLDGFRPGKVPLDVVKRLYGDSLIDEAKKAAMESASRQIFKEENLSISFHFANDIVKEDENGLEFTLKFELIPDFELKDHSSIKLFKYVVDITEDDINKLLDDIRRYKKRWIEDKKSKEVNEGQRIAIDMRLLSQLNKKVSENIEELEITIGDKSLVDDFWKHLIGMKVGEAREFDIQYPKDFSDKNFSGKKLRYSASIKKILKGEEYSLDDEFAKALGYEDFDKLKVWAKSSLTSRYEYMSQEIAKRELLEQMSQMYDFQVPSNMVAIEKSEVERQIKSEAPKYNKEFTPEIAAECLSIAEKRVRLGFIVAAIAKTEKVSVTQKEIAQAIKNVVAMYPGREKEIYSAYNRPEAMNTVVGPILETKVVNLLLSKMDMKEKKCTSEELIAIDEEPFDFFKDDKSGEKKKVAKNSEDKDTAKAEKPKKVTRKKKTED